MRNSRPVDFRRRFILSMMGIFAVSIGLIPEALGIFVYMAILIGFIFPIVGALRDGTLFIRRTGPPADDERAAPGSRYDTGWPGARRPDEQALFGRDGEIARVRTWRPAPDTRGTREEDPPDRPQAESPGPDGVYAHARRAMHAANLERSGGAVVLTDLGFMVYSAADAPPVIYRSSAIPRAVHSIQPFAALRLNQAASGAVRYEISDSDGQIVFTYTGEAALKQGENLLTPPARLRIGEAHNRRSTWHLRILADDVVLAEHAFGWEPTGTENLREHLSSDGEITPELRAMMARGRLSDEAGMSLDDLLGDPSASPSAQPARPRPRSTGRP
jgi:hypothetical protein